MRKILFLQLIFFALFEIHAVEDGKKNESPFFNYIDFKTAMELSLPKDDGSKKSIDTAAGFKLSLRDAELRLYDTFSSELPVRDFTGSFESPRYGFAIQLFQKSFPTTLKAGMNSQSKSISKIKSPAPSTTANPLQKSFALPTGISTSIPTLTSSKQPVSASVSVEIPESTFLGTPRIDATMDEEMNAAVSASSERKIGKFSSVQFALTGARYFIENESKTLKKAGAAFDAGFYLSGLAECSFKAPVFKTKARLGIQGSPYETTPVWTSADLRTGFKNLLVDFSFFAIPTSSRTPKAAPIIGANSSVQRTTMQIGVNPQTVFFIDGKNSASIRLGAHAVAARKVTSSKNAEELEVGKIRLAESFESKAFSIRHDLTVANILISGNPPNKSTTPEKYVHNSISASVKSEDLRVTADAGLKHIPPYSSEYPGKNTVSASISANPGKDKSLTLAGKMSVTFKDSEMSGGELAFSSSYRFKSKRIRSSIKCGVEIPF